MSENRNLRLNTSKSNSLRQFVGINARGQIQIRGETDRFLYSGEVFELYKKDGKTKRKPVHKTDDFIGSSDDHSFISEDKDGVRHRVIGSCVRQRAIASQNEIKPTPNSKNKKQGIAALKMDEYTQQLARIKAEKAANVVSFVRLNFVVAYVSESRASIYRKMKLGLFPRPIKRNGSKGAYWRLSDIDAYRMGRFSASDAAPAILKEQDFVD